MAELEKVIRGLECQYEPRMTCYGCDHFIVRDKLCNKNKIFREAVDLLKAQEPVSPTIKQEMDDICSCIDDVAYCGRCGERIGRLKQNYCQNCGKKVKWE